jgi:hypothetical protein
MLAATRKKRGRTLPLPIAAMQAIITQQISQCMITVS